MMKLAVILSLGLSANVFAQDSVEMAKSLFQKRGEDYKNSIEAGEMYARLAKLEENKFVKAKLLISEAQATYYVGTQVKEDAEKQVYFDLGMQATREGIEVICEEKFVESDANVCAKAASLTEDEKEILAFSYYQYGANLGKWAEAKGISASLGRWGELEKTMKKVIALKKEYVASYGPYRILGRAFYKLPFPLGSNKKAETFLRKAFDLTKNGQDISTYGLNVLYFVDLLTATDRKAEAKAILESFVQKDPETLDVTRIPETKAEIVEAMEKLKNL